MEPITKTKTQSVINRSAVKAFALKVSKERRAGKFTRVSENFLTQVEADVEAAIRAVDPAAMETEEVLITGEAISRIRVKLNQKALALVTSRVMRHPSLGVTLMD
jgi:hypothetical protein